MFNVQVIRPACYYVHAYNYFQFFLGIHGEAGVTRLKVFIVKYLLNHHSFIKLPTHFCVALKRIVLHLCNVLSSYFQCFNYYTVLPIFTISFIY